ncbi:MAG TPA: hypothetical protein VFD41_12495 [Actinomycetales bacterium]|nr:hypothetical protein [Actinomycetales bacterium]
MAEQRTSHVSTTSSGWRAADPGDLVGRLEAARDLLRSAAALEAAAQARTLAAMTEQQRRRVEEVRLGRVRRRRYR